MIVIFSLFTSFFAISLKVNSNSMAPTVDKGSLLILAPTQNINLLLQKEFNSDLRRGEIVLSGTNFMAKSKFWEYLADPIVRVFTLQKKSLIYRNSDYLGKGELLRVVGIPGDTIKIKDDTIYIKPKDSEFFLSEFELNQIDYDTHKRDLTKDWKSEYPFSSELENVVIEEGFYYLVSDNREILNDSRIWGAVNKDKIRGRILLKYWPVNEFAIY